MPYVRTLGADADALPAELEGAARSSVLLFPRRLLWAGALLVAAPALLVYALTLEPTLYFVDSGLMLAAVRDFGIAYSPGFPLYVILDKLWTLLAGLSGLGSFTQHANYFAGLAAAVAAVFIYLAVFWLLALRATELRVDAPGPATLGQAHTASRGTAARRHGGRGTSSRRRGTERERQWRFEAADETGRRTALAAAVTAGWLATFSYTIWSQAINADMYTLVGACAAAMLYLAVRLWQSGPVTPAPSPAQRRLALALCAAYGLAWSVHYLSIGLAPFMLLLVWRYRAWLRHRVAAVGVGLFLACAVLPYLYEPIRSAMWPQVDWAHVADPANLLPSLTGASWTTNASNFRLFDAQELGHWLYVTLWQFWPPALLAVAGGLYALWRRYRPLLLPLLVFYLGEVAVGVVYVTNNGESYLIPAHLVLALLAGLGLAEGASLVGGALGRLRARSPSHSTALRFRGIVPFGVAAVGIAVTGATVAANYPALDRHDAYVEQEYGQNALVAVPPGGIMLVPGDSLNSALLYLQVVRGYRRDVAVIPETVVQSRWWRDSFRRHHPAIVLPEINAIDPAGYLTTLIAALLRDDPGHTLYLLTLKDKRLPPGYLAVPAGIGYRVVRTSDDAARRVRRADWDFALGQARHTLHAPRDLQSAYNTFAREIQLAYVQAFQNLGDVDLAAGHAGPALRDYDIALVFYPDDPELRLRAGSALALAGRVAAALAYLPPAQRQSVVITRGDRDKALRTAFALAMNGVGLDYYNTGDFERARGAFTLASVIDPAYADALLDLGAALYQQGDDAAALAALQRGLRVAPRNAMIYYNLAQVYARLNRPAPARRMLDRAYALDPGLRPAGG